jgi:hypothetical protein
MKTKVIIVDNQNLSDEDFEFLSGPVERQFRNVSLNGVNTGWLGRELRTALDNEYDEVICVPVNALEVDIPAIRAASIANNAPLVVSDFETGPGGFFAIDKHFVYVDLAFFRSKNIAMDWGPVWQSTNMIGYPITVLNGNVLERATGTEYSNSFGPGWILLSSVLYENGRILSYPIELIDNIATVADSAIRQTATTAESAPLVDRWMQFVQDTRPADTATVISLNDLASTFVHHSRFP